MHRRTFLHTAGSVLAASALSSLAQNAPKKRKLKKAVNLGMVKVPGASVADKFKMVRDAGFHGSS
ncbi:MAG: hypothetical protein M3463_07670 [Verrucomicrobiota bacterium]|nr:hypothetical protein [Verrucomicrobiota bacterium]